MPFCIRRKTKNAKNVVTKKVFIENLLIEKYIINAINGIVSKLSK